MSKRQGQPFSDDLRSLAARLIRVATPGVLLAACGTTSPHTGQGGSGGVGGTGGTDAAAGTGGTSNLPAIPPPPVGGTPKDGGAAYAQCYGEGSPMLFGPCCLRVFCIDPPAGQTDCKPAAAVTSQDIGYPSLGSGTCMCSVPGRPAGFSGPYSPASAQQYSNSQGACCYLIGLQWCTGRPLIIDGRGVLAELVASIGWV